MSNDMTDTQKIAACVGHKFKREGYIYLQEVKRSTGFIKPERSADAIGISLFPSQGISLTGFEFKVSRSDLLAELRDPSKADAIKQFCDYWVLVVPAEPDILKGKIQIPDDWGIWKWYDDAWNGSYCVARKPKQLYPKPVDRYFMASLLRNARP